MALIDFLSQQLWEQFSCKYRRYPRVTDQISWTETLRLCVLWVSWGYLSSRLRWVCVLVPLSAFFFFFFFAYFCQIICCIKLYPLNSLSKIKSLHKWSLNLHFVICYIRARCSGLHSGSQGTGRSCGTRTNLYHKQANYGFSTVIQVY